ncbi:hypothetical protein [Candidatus Hepatobacter penaei]|uniref:hypothetical protein n=1 Tax=Candidatus Hepatobacter penaei TaxID=1274402 RepID=UPI0004F3ACE8|nr:hypothetical protein [Candidatus Hepatobacter penaei]
MSRSFSFLCCLWTITTPCSFLLSLPPKNDLCSWTWDNTSDQRTQGQADIQKIFPEATTKGGLFLSMREAETEQPGEMYYVPHKDIRYCRYDNTVFFCTKAWNVLTDDQGHYYEPNDFGTVLTIDKTSEQKTWHPLCALYLPNFTRGWIRWHAQAQEKNQYMLLSPQKLRESQVKAIWKQSWHPMSAFSHTAEKKDDTSSVPTDARTPTSQKKDRKRTQSLPHGERKKRRGWNTSSPSSASSAPSKLYKDEAKGEHARPVSQTKDTNTANGAHAAADSQKKENNPQEDTHRKDISFSSQPLLWAVTDAPPLDYRGVPNKDYVRPEPFFRSPTPLLQALIIMEKDPDLSRTDQLQVSTAKTTQDGIRTPKTLKKQAIQDYASELGSP